MKLLTNSAIVLCLSFAATMAEAGDAVIGAETTFQSWFGVNEKCVRISPIPDGSYDNDDVKDERDLCEIDFYSHDVALCPKIWSTSVAVVIYDISSGLFEGERLQFQQEVCVGGKVAKYVAKDELGKLKFAINRSKVSSGFSSPLLYYHFSRYLDLSIKVPVAVWRSIDAKVLLGEVAIGGIIFTEDKNTHIFINNAWHRLVEIIEDPLSNVRLSSYGEPEDILTTDGEKAHGFLLNSSGRSYGPELDSSVNSVWSAREYDELQMTPAFTALASDAPLNVAISFARSQTLGYFSEDQDEVKHLSPQQLAFSMRDLSEVLLIDSIMAQQDRPGNIDYKPYYYWLDNEHVMRVRAEGRTPGEGKVPEDAVSILRMMLNDNDAGGLYDNDNQTVLFGMLERFRHFDAKTYRLLMELDADFQSGGPIHTWLFNSLGLRESKVQMIVDNTALAAKILRATCEAGTLRFDLEPKQFFATGYVTPDTQSCSINERHLLTVGPLKIYSTVDDWVAHVLSWISAYSQWLEQVLDRQSVTTSE